MRHHATALVLGALLLSNQIGLSQAPRINTPAPKKNQDTARIKQLSDSIDVLTKIESDPQFIPTREVKDLLDAQIHQMTCEKNELVLVQTLSQPAEVKHLVAKTYYEACLNAKKPPEPAPVQSVTYSCKLPGSIDLVQRQYQSPKYSAKPSPPQTADYRLLPVDSVNNSGNQVSGPRTIQVQYINPLRFDYGLGVKTTIEKAPTLPAALVPAVTAFAQGGSAKGASEAAPGGAPGGVGIASEKKPIDFGPTFASYRACYEAHAQRAHEIDALINNAAQVTNLATNAYTQVLNVYASIILNPGEPGTMQSAANDQKVFGDYYDFPWPTADVTLLSGSLSKFADDYQSMSQLNGYSDWIKDEGNKQTFTYYQGQVAALQQHLAGLGPGSDVASKLNAAQNTVDGWRERFYKVAHLKQSDFTPISNVPCDMWFGKSSTNIVQLKTRDQFSPNATEQSADLVTVVCNSTLSVTTGIGFTTLQTQTPAFVAGVDKNGNVQQQLGYSAQANVSPIYALQINMSIHEWYGWAGTGIHATLGAAIGTTSGTGATLDFLFGPSVSFRRRTFFVTPAFLLGQRTEFLPGFKPGDPQGSLTSPPTILKWRPGFATTVTFPISQ